LAAFFGINDHINIEEHDKGVPAAKVVGLISEYWDISQQRADKTMSELTTLV
jgi:hypothetical protein